MTRPGSAQAGDRGPTILRWIHEHAPNSTQLMGFLTLLISSAILLILTGLTVTAAVTGLVFFAPIILISSPVWVPAAAVLFIGVTGFLSACGVGVAVLSGATWMYRYFSGRQPVGSGRVDYARSRMAHTAREVKDYAREHGIYFPSRVKDAAPGA